MLRYVHCTSICTGIERMRGVGVTDRDVSILGFVNQPITLYRSNCTVYFPGTVADGSTVRRKRSGDRVRIFFGRLARSLNPTFARSVLVRTLRDRIVGFRCENSLLKLPRCYRPVRLCWRREDRFLAALDFSMLDNSITFSGSLASNTRRPLPEPTKKLYRVCIASVGPRLLGIDFFASG